jgi:hypothetical protein
LLFVLLLLLLVVVVVVVVVVVAGKNWADAAALAAALVCMGVSDVRSLNLSKQCAREVSVALSPWGLV